MKYKLTFTVNDESEDAKFCERENIVVDYVVECGCDLAKILNQDSVTTTYCFVGAEILED